jgi:His-Xaa-Ser system protein HxsD
VATDPKNADPISWTTDSLGAFACLSVNTAVYSKTALFKAAYWYTERCYLFLSRPLDTPSTIQVEIRPKSTISQPDLIALCREFANSLIDQQVRQEVIAETGNVRDALIKKAFFEGSNHLDPDKLSSNEEHVPTADQSYKNDPLKIARTTGS